MKDTNKLQNSFNYRSLVATIEEFVVNEYGYSEDITIASIVCDSRKVRNASVLFALKGHGAIDGNGYITKAVVGGAKIICSELSILEQVNRGNIPNFEYFKINKVSYLHLKQIDKAANILLERYYNNIPQNIIAITGTNGKSSTVSFICQLLQLLGYKSASIGTLGILIDGDINKNIYDTGLTSPDKFTLYSYLQELKTRYAVDFIAIEASSHGLQQNRFGNLLFDVMGFLNFTQDHLDYHKTMRDYFAAKMKIFTEHKKQKSIAVINELLSNINDVTEVLVAEDISFYSFYTGDKNHMTKMQPLPSLISRVNIGNITTKNWCLSFDLSEARQSEVAFNEKSELKNITNKLIGDFQAENITAAYLSVRAILNEVDKISSASINWKYLLSQLKSPRGRMELLTDDDKNRAIIIDYAHTPDGLEQALKTIKRIPEINKLYCLFGCGGDRDKEKRPKMAKVAMKYSDMIYVTDDNPRTENPDNIRKDITSAFFNGQEFVFLNYQEVSEGRAVAIESAVKNLPENSVLLVAGKGHEDYQIIGTQKIHFDDAEIVRSILNYHSA